MDFNNLPFTVELSSNKEFFLLNNPINIICKIYNSSLESQSFCKYHTPFEGVQNRIFTLIKDGKNIPYKGKLIKRLVPIKKDYVDLQSKGTISCTVDISSSYDLSKKGEYFINYKGSQISNLPDSLPLQFIIK